MFLIHNSLEKRLKESEICGKTGQAQRGIKPEEVLGKTNSTGSVSSWTTSQVL